MPARQSSQVSFTKCKGISKSGSDKEELAAKKKKEKRKKKKEK